MNHRKLLEFNLNTLKLNETFEIIEALEYKYLCILMYH